MSDIEEPEEKKLHLRPHARAFLLILLFSIVVFRVVLPSDQVLFTTDDNIGALALGKSQMPQGFFGRWDDSILVGTEGLIQLSWTSVLLYVLPVKVFSDWIHAIDLVLGSLFLLLFLRDRKIQPSAALIGVLTAYWLGSTFTLTYAGHTAKFGVVMFAGLYLWLVERAVSRQSVAYALLAGGAMGAMFLEQPDSALFFAIPLGLYAVYGVLREKGLSIPVMARVIVPLLLVAGCMAFRPVWSAKTLFATPSVATSAEADPKEQWDFATQWSYPPMETVDFIAPGYTGWRSHEPTGPYWGRMGRSAEWDTSKQGFQNFRLENFYMGAIPVCLAAWAVALGFAWRRRKSSYAFDALFWGGITLITYLLSLGKFFPLYSIFYTLPGISSIRNPVKFMQVTQLALGVLAAMGAQSWINRSESDNIDIPAKLTRRYITGVSVLGALLLGRAMMIVNSLPQRAAQFNAEGFGAQADLMVQNMSRALVHGGLMTLAVAGLAAFVLLGRSKSNSSLLIKRAVWILVAVVALDALALSRHYVKPFSVTHLENNELAKMMKGDMKQQRAALTSQASFYNNFLTYLFPFHGIPTLNFGQMPRMPKAYEAFLGTVGNNPLRLWQYSAVSLILGPGGIWNQFQSDAAIKDFFEIAYAYNVGSDAAGNIQVIPATQQQPGQHVVLRYKAKNPRYTLIGNWVVLEDEEALSTMASPDFAPFSRAIISADTREGLPEAAPQNVDGQIQLIEARSGFVRLKVSTSAPSILRLADKYSKYWNATVNGEAARLRRCDYLFQGLYLEPGLHDVVVRYRQPASALMVQLFGMTLCGGAMVGLLIARRKADANDGEQEA